MNSIGAIKTQLLNGIPVSQDQLYGLLSQLDGQLDPLLKLASELRMKAFGPQLRKCSDGFTNNICSGGCKYCFLAAQNRRNLPAGFNLPRKLNSVGEIVEDAKSKERKGATQYKIVGAEYKIRQPEFEMALAAFRILKNETELGLCASMGWLSYEQLCRLRDVGVDYYNHNLETSREKYESLGCKATYDDRIRQNIKSKRAGLKRCSGLIIGLGEAMHDRLEVAFTLRDVIGVESMPLNIFVPLGPEQHPAISPEEGLLTLAIFRIIMPNTHIIANNGTAFFGQLWPQVTSAGASGVGMRDGNYLSHARANFEE